VAKISRLPQLNDPDGSEEVVAVRGGQTGRSPLAPMVQPFVDQASAYAAAAAALLNPQPSFAEGVGATAEGEYFAVLDPASGWISCYRNGTSPDAETPIIRLPGDRAYAGLGGLAMIGAADGKTAQQKIDEVNHGAGDELGYSSGALDAAVFNVAAKLREAPVSLEEFGAVGDGVSDDAPALRRALAWLKLRGGGTLRLRAGTFYKLASGDPRGLDLFSTTGVHGFYAIAEAVSGVTIEGSGDDCGFIYDPNRLGHRSSSGVLDAGAIFANHRVAAPTDAPAEVSFIRLRNFAVNYLPIAAPSNAGDGCVLRLYSNAGAVANGVVIVDGVVTRNHVGSQVFSVEKADGFYATGCRFYNSARDANAGINDVSLFYVTGTVGKFVDNYGYNTKVFGTFIEAHCKFTTIQSNEAEGFGTFCNAVSQIVHPSPFYDNALFVILGNIAVRVVRFVTDYCYAAGCRKDLLALLGNTVNLAVTLDGLSAADTAEYIVAATNDRGDAEVDILPTTNLIVKNNLASSALTPDVITESTSALALIADVEAVNLTVADNTFGDVRRGIVGLLSAKLRKAVIARNSGRFGARATDGANSTALGARTGVKVLLSPGSAGCDISVTDNRLAAAYAGAQPCTGVAINNQAAATFTNPIAIRRNDITVPQGSDLSIVQGVGSHFDTGSITIDHDHSVFPAGYTDHSALLLVGSADAAALAEGSRASFKAVSVQAVYDGPNLIVPSQFWGSAAPETGFWARGSRVWFPSPLGSFMGAVCTASGSPGTWKRFGGVEE